MKTDDKKKEILKKFTEKFVDQRKILGKENEMGNFEFYVNIHPLHLQEWLSSTLDSYAETVRLQTIEEFEDIIMDFSAVVIGTVWGINAGYRIWSDNDSKLFNNTVVDARNKALKALNQSQDTSVGTKNKE